MLIIILALYYHYQPYYDVYYFIDLFVLFCFSVQSERAQSEKPVEKYASTNGDDNIMINAAG